MDFGKSSIQLQSICQLLLFTQIHTNPLRTADVYNLLSTWTTDLKIQKSCSIFLQISLFLWAGNRPNILKRQALDIPPRQPLESCNLGWFLPTGFNGVLWSEACRARLVEPKPVFPTASQKIPTALWVVPGVLENQQQGIFRVWFQLAIFWVLSSFGCLGEKKNFFFAGRS